MFRNLRRTVKDLWETALGRTLLLGVVGVIGTGTVFYRLVEGLSWVDSLYFTVVTLMTVGYGDLTPSSDVAKLFTVVFIITGAGFIIGVLNYLITQSPNSILGRIGDGEAPTRGDTLR